MPAAQEETDFENSRALKLCREAVQGLAGEKRQWFVHLKSPALEGESRRAFRRIESKMAKDLKKAGHFFRSERAPGGEVTMTLGQTRVEDLSRPGLRMELPPALDLFGPAPKAAPEPLRTLEGADGELLEVLALPTDVLRDRSLQSPPALKPGVFLQFVPARSPEETAVVRTDFPDHRTGVLGALRSWQVELSGAFNSLVSARGEGSTWFGLPLFELRRLSSTDPWELRLRLGRDVLHLGSSLAVTELDAQVARRFESLNSLVPTVGFRSFALSGKNPGSSRIGGLSSLSFGAEISGGEGAWFWRGGAAGLFALGGLRPSLGVDAKFQLNRLWDTGQAEGWYAGSFLSLSRYRVPLLNGERIEEVFGETQLRLGIAFGWAGVDSLLQKR